MDRADRDEVVVVLSKMQWWRWRRSRDQEPLAKAGGGPSVAGGSLFRAVVAREHLRAIRSEGSFSVLVFHLNGPVAIEDAAERLARHLRDTDVIGQLDADQLGVLLRHADAEGATEVANHLVTVLDDGHTTVDCRVFPHPPPMGRPILREGPAKVQAYTTPTAGRSSTD